MPQLKKMKTLQPTVKKMPGLHLEAGPQIPQDQDRAAIATGTEATLPFILPYNWPTT
jgi:hypothetical protein